MIHSLGGSIGVPTIRRGVSYKAKFKNHLAIVLDFNVGVADHFLQTPHDVYSRDIFYGKNGHYDYEHHWNAECSILSFTLQPLFLYNTLSGKQFDWYAGGGPMVGFMLPLTVTLRGRFEHKKTSQK